MQMELYVHIVHKMLYVYVSVVLSTLFGLKYGYGYRMSIYPSVQVSKMLNF